MSEPFRASADPVLAGLSIDDRDPAAAPVLESDELCKQLDSLWLAEQCSTARQIEVQILRWHKSKRCTFEISLRRDLIGKVYATDREDVYQVMERLARAGFGLDAEFSIPQPIAYLPSLRLLLQEKVEGLEAKGVFRFGDERQRAAAAERCARWLARFHALAPPSGQVSDVERILRRSKDKQELLSKEGGPLADKSEWLIEGLRSARSSLGAIPMCAGHGHFGCYQIILAGGRTVVFDWDVYDVADPTRDVAGFILSLKRQALRRLGSIRELDGAAQTFLEAYLTAGGHPRVASHLPFYTVAHCLRSAKWDVVRKPIGWREHAEALLDEGLRTLG